MYGMIHKALLGMLEEQLPPGAPNPLAAAHVERPDLFFSASSHEDAVTLGLVGQAAGALGLDADTFMQRFGEYWITFADRGAYAPLMRIAGSTLADFITNLDRLHMGVREAMPTADTPRFRLVRNEGGALVVAYASNRQGLESFVRGLLQGLLRRFGHSGSVARLNEGPNHEAWFRVVLDPEAA